MVLRLFSFFQDERVQRNIHFMTYLVQKILLLCQIFDQKGMTRPDIISVSEIKIFDGISCGYKTIYLLIKRPEFHILWKFRAI